MGERQSIEQSFNWRLNDVHRVQAGVGYQRYYGIETSSLSAMYDTDKGPADQGFYYQNTTLPLAIYDASFNNLSAYAQVQSEWFGTFPQWRAYALIGIQTTGNR